MSIIAADGLSVLVGDGAASEAFNVLKGGRVVRFELTQRNNTSLAVASDAWGVTVGTSARRMLLDIEALATDEAAATRLRALAMSGASGNVRLELSGAETLNCAAVVTLYREVTAAGDIKQLQCRLEGSGVPVIA